MDDSLSYITIGDRLTEYYENQFTVHSALRVYFSKFGLTSYGSKCGGANYISAYQLGVF